MIPAGLYLSRSADSAYAYVRLQNLDDHFPDSLVDIPALLDPANPVLGLHFTVDAPIGRKEDSVIERCIDYAQGDYAVTHGLLLSYNKEKGKRSRTSPEAMARYSRWIACARIISPRRAAACMFFAAISRPLVSRSRRFTMRFT